ncbi:doublecortin domain-containing 5 isoform X8, partial [Brachionus plicatilis]
IGEWRFSELSTALWHKLAYTWPVDHEEKLIEQFKWPISGYLIAGAPPLKNLKNSEENMTCRLRVLKNGSTDLNSAISLTRTNAKHFLKDYLHCSNLTPKQFEFNSFLNTCTISLNLANAARRLFDLKGIEHFELSHLKNEEYVYVSCGEAWIDPKVVRDEQSKKLILSNLSEDLNKILYLLKLKSCQNFVIETSGLSIQDGAKLCLGPCCLSEYQIDRIKQGESIQNVIEVDLKEEETNGEEKINYKYKL